MAAGTPRQIRGSDVGQVLNPQSVYAESELAVVPVGTRLQLGDRVFRYASAGAALARGYLLASAPLNGATTTNQIDLAVVAAAAGARSLTVTTGTTAQVADRFKDGYATIVSDTAAHGAGVAYKIKSHPGQAAAGALVITLYDEISEALTADCKVSLCANLWARVVQTPVTTAAGLPIGVALCAVQSGYHFWCQTWGPAAVLTGSTVIVDSAIIRGLEDGESDIQTTSGITPEIAWSIEAGTDGDFPLTFLRIAP